MSYFFMQAELGKHSGARKPEEIRQDYRDAAQLATLAAPFRHSRLTAVKIAGDPLYNSGTMPPPTSCAQRL